MNELSKSARHILEKGRYTCVILKGSHIYTSQMRGVKPLVVFLRSRLDLSGAAAADRVVGRATAFLYVLLGVDSLYAHIISEAALEVLRAHGIKVNYTSLVPHIINRQGDGICPFEEAVLGISQPDAALLAIEQKMAALGIQ